MNEVLVRLTEALADRYRIERELGSGGMAIVYLAYDLKHDRKVALKVLRPELAAVIGAERFVGEIKVTANLQHPHILPLHDSGEADGFLFYVMPYVEGETLRDRLEREKQLGIEEAIEISRSVAAALDYAHRHDVIHRDIKPENILLHDEQALVADFGIALAVTAAGGHRLTETGLSLGTPQYMSPEQAVGDREIDARTDIYSLGCVLYEMLAGDPPYMASTAQAIFAKVITEKTPEVTASRETVPPHTAAALRKALAKLPADRFGSAADFAEALVRPGAVEAIPAALAVTAAPETPTVTAKRTAADRLRRALPWALLAIAGAVALWGWLRPSPRPRLARFEVALPAEAPLVAGTSGNTIALSPDGTQLVYVGPNRQLFVRRIDQLEARPLPGTEGAHTPFFSPDGRWVGFYAAPELKRVALAGGPPLTVATATQMRGASWGPDDVIVFAPNPVGGLLKVSAGGGPVDTLTTPDASLGETSHRWPQILPGGEAILFTIFSGTVDDAQTGVLLLENGEIRRLIAGMNARYAETGHLIYGSADFALLAVPFDRARLEVTGSPVSLLEDMMVKNTGASEFALSGDGSLAYLSGEAVDVDLVMVDRAGSERTLLTDLPAPIGPRLSPDGGRIAARMQERGSSDIWIYNLRGGTMSRLTFEGDNFYPTWTPDGRTVAFSSERGESGRDMYMRASDGSGVAELLLERENPVWEISWSREGDHAAFREVDSSTGRDIWILPLDGSSDPRPYLRTPFNERSPQVSPDGRWLAYVSNETGRDEVYVRAFPEPSGKWQVSTAGGSEPLWDPRRPQIYYRDGNQLVAVEVQTEPVFSLGAREVLFEGTYRTGLQHTNYDIDPASGEFLMLKSAEQATSLVVVLNWFEELRARMLAPLD
jgi:dipeptidyl aminopeptidase/acylaminoacyl peptidase